MGVPEEYRPVPASKLIPDWYKNLESHVGGEKKPHEEGSTRTTAKRCMPIFDAISSGYIISTHADLWISQKTDEDGKTYPYYQWANFNAIDFHPKHQLPEHPDGAGHELTYPKWTNTWAITTPLGYSCIFIPPLHRETPIMIFPGVVDTDKYRSPVNFPFVLRNTKMEGLIPAGTPIAQVIPFKRDSWKTKIGDEKELIDQEKITRKLKTLFFDSYKRQFRQPKEYR